MAMTLEAAEAEYKERLVVRGGDLEREKTLNANTLAALQVNLTVVEIPSIDQVVLSATVLTEVQRKFLTELWDLRAKNYIEFQKLTEVEKMLAVLREKKGEEKTVKKDGSRGEGGRKQDLDFKKIGHLKDSKFGGKDGGAGWTSFVEDLRVVLGSVNKELEEGVSVVMDLKNKDFDDMEEIKKHVELIGEGTWTKYSGELFARLMEITKDDAQKLVRGEGVKSKRCGFWVMRKLAERYNPRSYQRHLRLLMNVMKYSEAKGVKDVQATIEDWGIKLGRVQDEYEDVFTDNLKVALLISMMPDAIQEKIFEME